MVGGTRIAAVLLAVGDGTRLGRGDLVIEAEELRELQDRLGPCALVVDRTDLPHFRELGELSVDRRCKEPSKGLAAKLLGHYPRIPRIDAGYKVAGRALQGVRALLRAAVRHGEGNLYVIGVPARLFGGLRSLASPLPETAADPGDLRGWRGELLELIPARTVPPQLVRTFVGRSPSARLVRQLILIAAEHDHPVLILGDTGTGKEVVARAIHDQGARRHQRLVPVNCGAIPRELLESELFGAMPGAYTGAPPRQRKRGLWEAAHLGTIFLDEIGDLPPDQQVKVLRTIDHGTLRAVGGDREQKVDARVLAATNRDLLAMVEDGRFREDLYYRLRGFLIRTPALREHPEDIPLLAQHFWRRISRDRGGRLPLGILDELRRYGWPGNARELKSVLANLYVFFGEVLPLTARHLRAVFELQGQRLDAAGALTSFGVAARRRLEDVRYRQRVSDALRTLDVAMHALAGAEQPASEVAGAARLSLMNVAAEVELLAAGRSDLDPRAHSAFDALRDTVRFLARLLEDDPKEAVRLWRTRGARELQALRGSLATP